MFSINGTGTTIYGNARRIEFSGPDKDAAESQGYEPASYQVIKWVVILSVPIVPLGTYRVMKVKGADEYSMKEADWDWGQVLRHGGIVWAVLAYILWHLAMA